MPPRLNTIIIVPHSKAKFIKFSFSTRSLILACSGLFIALVLSIVAIGYTGSAVSRRAQVEHLHAENQQLTRVNQELETTIAEVQARLDEFEERTARLALATGMESEPVAGSEIGSASVRMGSGGPYDRMLESPETLYRQSDLITQRLENLEALVTDRSRMLACKPSIAPVLGILTDGFGRRKDPITGRRAFHRGLDISARRGTPVVAPADGVVVSCGYDRGFGRVVRLSHGFGYSTVFGHLHRILVSSGDEVRRGDQIAQLGSTGRSTGPHLHYEVLLDGRAVNPLHYILNAY